jgi:D-serine deaminase-like pyridoxal phosphate-dependent protein
MVEGVEKYRIVNEDEITTPALVIYRDMIAENIRRIGEILGGNEGLRPHIKTHKMSRVAKMQLESGIKKFKCATPKEAALLIGVGAVDILIAYPIVGKAMQRVIDLKKEHPAADLKVIADDMDAVYALSKACVEAGVNLGVMIDLNTGMDRTGAYSPEAAVALSKTINELPGLCFEGLHAYDGHVSDPSAEVRKQDTMEAIDKAIRIKGLIEKEGPAVKTVIASGSPSFEFNAQVPEVDEVSPGTWIFWDSGYEEKMPGRFRWAALVLSTVISRPGPDLITLDAGSKAISPDTPAPHFRALGLPEDIQFVVRSEEHQALRLPPGTPVPSVGDVLYLVSRHICTTINLFDEAHIIDGRGRFIETWPVDGRGH